MLVGMVGEWVGRSSFAGSVSVSCPFFFDWPFSRSCFSFAPFFLVCFTTTLRAWDLGRWDGSFLALHRMPLVHSLPFPIPNDSSFTNLVLFRCFPIFRLT